MSNIHDKGFFCKNSIIVWQGPKYVFAVFIILKSYCLFICFPHSALLFNKPEAFSVAMTNFCLTLLDFILTLSIQAGFVCSKLTIETIERGVSGVVLMSLC